MHCLNALLGHVQHRVRIGSRGEVERATRAMLETLAERLVGNEAHDLAAQLPPELVHSLQPSDAGIGATLTLDKFFRAGERARRWRAGRGDVARSCRPH